MAAPGASGSAHSGGEALRRLGSGGYADPAVVIAVVSVRMMEVPLHEVVGVIAVRHRLVAATRPMLVTRVVGAAVVIRGTRRRVLRANRQRVLVHVVSVGVVQVSVVQVIGVAVVLNRRMAALGTVLVAVVSVGLAVAHRIPPGSTGVRPLACVGRNVGDEVPIAASLDPM